MATLTPNIGLKKPAGSEYPKISDAVNDNADILDEKIGPVGNTSLQTQISNEATARQNAVAKLRKGLSYVEDGTTIAANANYTAGKFICWQGEMYRIKATINVTVTSGNWTTYLDKMDGMGGALSQINADLTSLNDRIPTFEKAYAAGIATETLLRSICLDCKTKMSADGSVILQGIISGVNSFIAICTYTAGYPVTGICCMFGSTTYEMQLAPDDSTLTYHMLAVDYYPDSSASFTVILPLMKNGAGASVAQLAFPYMKTPIVTSIRKAGDTDVTSEFTINMQSPGQLYVYTWQTSYNSGDVVQITYHF